MGEYLDMKNGDSVKLGTCEDLYYTTHKQFVANLPMFKDLALAKTYLRPNEFRFRFPFPDENIKIGSYNDFNRGVLFSVPDSLGIEMCHEEKFIRTGAKDSKYPQLDFGVSIPCFQTPEFGNLKHHDWGNNRQLTHFEITQQKIVLNEDNFEELQTVIRCPYCGACSRLSYEEVASLMTHQIEQPEYFDKFQKEILSEVIHGYVAERCIHTDNSLTEN